MEEIFKHRDRDDDELVIKIAPSLFNPGHVLMLTDGDSETFFDVPALDRLIAFLREHRDALATTTTTDKSMATAITTCRTCGKGVGSANNDTGIVYFHAGPADHPADPVHAEGCAE